MTLGPRPVVGETGELAVGFCGGELCDRGVRTLLKKLTVVVRGRRQPGIAVIQLQRSCTLGIEVEAALDGERLDALDWERRVISVFNGNLNLLG